LGESVARRVLLESGPSDVQHVAVRENDLEPENVGTRRAVAEAACPRRVARNRTANRDVVLARRVGGEEQTFGRDRALEVAQTNTCLDARRSRAGIDVDDAIEATK
jgi:hypothetical protein